MTMNADRVGSYLAVIDGDGCRHMIRIASIQMVSDGDQCRDTTVMVVAGRAITVAESLDDVLPMLTIGPRCK